MNEFSEKGIHISENPFIFPLILWLPNTIVQNNCHSFLKPFPFNSEKKLSFLRKRNQYFNKSSVNKTHEIPKYKSIVFSFVNINDFSSLLFCKKCFGIYE